MSKSRTFLPILIPSATVFLSSACIMIIEIVAGRLIARHLGSSLYTWTTVIGVVLAGITVGNYVGGRIADKFNSRKALAFLFGLASVACVSIVVLNNLVGKFEFLLHLSLPLRVFCHISLVFLLPSTLLGTISPVVAKMALDRGLATGRTVGDIYAWGAAGSIAGTFLAGFYLIAAMGTISVVWTVSGVLLFVGILYWAKFWLLYIWAIILVCLMTMGMAPAEWAEEAGTSMALRSKTDDNVLLEMESQYSYIAVRQLSKTPDIRAFYLDKLKHSEINMDDFLDLRYFYTHIYAAIANTHCAGREDLSFMVIGGGGYAYPTYLDAVYPGSKIDVVEIDPAVTDAAVEAFGLDPDNKNITGIAMDARNFVDQLLDEEKFEGKTTRYDIIYEDAITDYSVPYQLMTDEFNKKIYDILKDDGVYAINIVDVLNIGKFLGSVVATLEETFPHVSIIAEKNLPKSARDTFVIVASKQPIDWQDGISKYEKGSKMSLLSDEIMSLLDKNSGGIILTDDYAPVENMLAPVVCRSALDFLSHSVMTEAEKLAAISNYDESIAKYKYLAKINPEMSIKAYNDIALIYARQGKMDISIEYFEKALKYNDESEFKDNMANIHFSLGVAFQRSQKPEQATEHFKLAAEGYRFELQEDPRSMKSLMRLGDALASYGNFEEAADAFAKAIPLNPSIMSNYTSLAISLEKMERYDEAIVVLTKAQEFMRYMKDEESASKLQDAIDLLKYRKSQQADPANGQ